MYQKQDRLGHVKACYDKIRADGVRIHELVKENMELFQAEEDSDMWALYVEHLDRAVVEGLYKCVNCSLQYMLINTDRSKADLRPLLECKLELQVPETVFHPSLDQEDPNGFYCLVDGLLEDIFK